MHWAPNRARAKWWAAGGTSHTYQASGTQYLAPLATATGHLIPLGTTKHYQAACTTAVPATCNWTAPRTSVEQAPMVNGHHQTPLGNGHQASLLGTMVQWAAGIIGHHCVLVTTGHHQVLGIPTEHQREVGTTRN